jgi:ABC-2 type transport system permease protein
MTALIRSEFLKQRTTRTTALVVLSMAGLLALVVLLHVLTLKTANLAPRDGQLMVIGWGTGIGTLFAAILGALTITAEFRHGSIRPTLLVTPRRGRVVAAKLLASLFAGLAAGILAEGLAAALETTGLAARGIPISLTSGDFARLLGGGAIAAGLFAAIGVGIGAAVRNQVATIIGLCIWSLLIETILIGNVPSAGKYTPGAAAGAIAGAAQTADPARLIGLVLGFLLLAGYALAAAGLGARAITRRDIS